MRCQPISGNDAEKAGLASRPMGSTKASLNVGRAPRIITSSGRSPDDFMI